MPDPHYPWQRYWCARGAAIPLDNVGFLADPEGQWGRFVATGLQPLHEVANRGALVLLGEPGLGKSDALAAAAMLRRSDASLVVLTPNLQAINSAQQLQQLFASPAIRGWTEGTSTLHLYLDAVDECRLRVDVFGELLVELLRELPLDRMRLYLACRTTEWPATLEADLVGLLAGRGQRLDAYELAPLRRRDVEIAAAAHELDPAVVLDTIERRGAVPLALKPVTLRLLLSTFAGGAFPDSQLGLYAAGMRALVTESQHRRETQLAGTLDATERLAIAARIAAITTLTGRATIDPTAAPVQPSDGVVATWEIAEGHEQVRGRDLPVTEAAVAEVLDTGLFSLRGERHLGWAHQTYAEYLTAEHVRTRDLAAPQVASLLRSADGRVIPQLHGVAAWIAAVAPTHFAAVAASDPEILVASDVVLPSDTQKRELVAQLLRRAADGLRLDVLLARKLGKLAHPALRDQLAPYLRGEQGTYEQRDLALDLAIFAREEPLLADVCALALNDAAPLDLRQTAALGVITFGSSALRAQLKPLITATTDDPTERLNWLGTYAAWPTALTPDELFAALAARPRRSRLQTYSIFPVDEIAAGFTRETLPRGLAWAARREAALGRTYRTQRRDSVADDLVDALLIRAWEFFDDDATIATGFTRIVWSRFRRYDPMAGSLHNQDFAERVRANVARRRALVARLLRRCTAPEDVNRVLVSDPRLLTVDDLPWITEQLAAATVDHERTAYATALVRLADVHRPDDFTCVAAALDLSALVREQLGWTREVVELGSARADELRRAHAAAESARQRQEAATRRAPSRDVLHALLDGVTAAEPGGWWEFARLLTLSDAQPDFGDEYERDLTALPGWAALDAEHRVAALAAAETYLLHADPEPDAWLGQPIYHRPAAAGPKALGLLAKVTPERFARLPANVWERWAVAVLGTSTNAAEIPLLREAYTYAPDAILRTVDALITAEDRQHGDVLVVRALGSIWNERIAERLFGHVADTTLGENARARLLDALLERRHAPAVDLAEHVLTPLPAPDAPDRAWARRVAVLLLTHAPDLAWASLWTALADDAFGREVLTDVAHQDRFRGAVVARLSDEQLGALFTLVAQRFPSRTDPRHASGEGFTPTLRDDVATWRNMLLTTLIHRGTATAVAAIRAAMVALPEEPYLIRVLRDAEAKRRQREWRPIAIPELLALAARHDLRFVESAAQLAEVVLEVLDRLARLLHGETPLIGFLWNEMRLQRQLRRRPKTETQLSDFIKAFLDLDLRQRGVVVNREVQIRPAIGRGTGEITDIHVDAVRADQEPVDRITTVVEVKGCWNPELRTAMRTQLRDRYLRDTENTGIYCVGWFQCLAWDASDTRRRAMRGTSIESVMRDLRRQAQRIAPTGTIRAAVLDLRLPTPSAPQRRPRSRQR
jgi:hypothetical protein